MISIKPINLEMHFIEKECMLCQMNPCSQQIFIEYLLGTRYNAKKFHINSFITNCSLILAFFHT